ncbi:hypothetical protein GGI35DRAFT_444779 [Trichoderma velutinum]
MVLCVLLATRMPVRVRVLSGASTSASMVQSAGLPATCHLVQEIHCRQDSADVPVRSAYKTPRGARFMRPERQHRNAVRPHESKVQTLAALVQAGPGLLTCSGVRWFSWSQGSRYTTEAELAKEDERILVRQSTQTSKSTGSGRRGFQWTLAPFSGLAGGKK